MGWFSKDKEPEEVTPEPKPTKVKVLGVRTSEETKGTKNYLKTRYCLLVEHDDGSRSIYEYNRSNPELESLLYLIPMD